MQDDWQLWTYWTLPALGSAVGECLLQTPHDPEGQVLSSPAELQRDQKNQF